MSNRDGNVDNMAERNRQIAQMQNIRIFYEKKGRAKFISHLDITRCMQRALKRAEIPVWYTQGFNPHMYLTFALPLALGYESEYECMDLRLSEPMEFEEIQTRLNASLPDGILIKRVALQKHKPQELCQAEYEITLTHAEPEILAGQFTDYCAQPEIIVQKRTKKGTKAVDLKPEFEALTTRIQDSAVCLRMIFTAGQKNINPSLLIDAFLEHTGQEELPVSIVRKLLYIAERVLFE